MLKSIKRKINKTPIENSSTIIREVSSMSEELFLNIFTAQHIGEGVFGIEQFSTNDTNELYFFTPSLQRINIGTESNQLWNWSEGNYHKHIKCYEINLSNPTFLPIYTETEINLLEDLNLLTNKDVEIFTQVIFSKRIDDWRMKVVGQYEEFLRGNDYPSAKRTTRLFQRNMIKVFEKLEGESFKREPIEEIEQKILDDGFRVEIRIIMMSDSEKQLNQTENELKVLLKDYDYFNELELSTITKHYKKEFLQNIEKRKFSPDSINQIFSLSELESILSTTHTTTQPKLVNTPSPSVPNKANVSKNNLFELLPIGEKKERLIDHSIVKSISNALNRVGVTKGRPISSNKIQQGATLQKVSMHIPEGVNYSDIFKKQKDIQTALGYDSLAIEQGDEANTIAFTMPCGERETVYLKELIEKEDFVNHAKEAELPFIVGVDVLGNVIFDDLTKLVHLLIAGATGGGKSQYLCQMLLTLLLMKKPEELMMYLVDPKMVELSFFEGIPHVQDVITEMDKAIKVFDSLVIEMEKRYEKFSKSNCRDIQGYNKKHPKNKMPYIVVAVDEFYDLVTQYPEVEDYIARLGAKARAAGLHLIIATQYPKAEIISTTITANLPSAISFRLKKNKDYGVVFGTGIPYTLLGKGDGVAKLEGQIKEFERFQSPVITLDNQELEDIFGKLKKSIGGNGAQGINLEKEQEKEVIKENPKDQLKRIIANTGELRIGKLREQMGIRINTVKDLMIKLVEEGWLETPENRSKGYTLIASEEELNKWKS